MNQPADMPLSSREDRLEAAICESLGGRWAARATAALASAWTWSASRRLLAPVIDGWRTLPSATRVRTSALTLVIAMLVHLAAARLGTPEPLGAVVPVLVMLGAGLLALAAAPVARAMERLTR